MLRTKLPKILFVTLLLVISVMYNTMNRSASYKIDTIKIKNFTKELQKNITVSFKDSSDYLINTPGCVIPNYSNTLQIKETLPSTKTCGERAVFVTKINNDKIKFKIDKSKMAKYSKAKSYTCCCKNASPSTALGKVDYRTLRYSQCKKFENGTEAPLEHEILVVTCYLAHNKNKLIYEDAYAIVKKVKIVKNKEDQKSWNVLILGMDTMSRARAYTSMPKTAAYLSENNWLDYRGYQKVGYNTFPNVMALLTGMNVSAVYNACASGMDTCNELILWSAFQKAGYVTGTGEDNLNLPDTFSHLGYKNSPTDHYLRPFFLTGEHNIGNFVCTKKIPSGKHLLNYALQFADSYKSDKFFGMFWMNSFSHNIKNTPNLIDEDMIAFFKKLHSTGVLNSTFVFLLSDHGIRYGNQRIPYESYYEERLPMLFVWVPQSFKEAHFEQYNSMVLNQDRLVTTYDIYFTMKDILIKSTSIVQKVDNKTCLKCVSIFTEIPPTRTCNDANVYEKWCTCHEMMSISENNLETNISLKLAVTNLQDKMRKISTTNCMECVILELKKLLRAHTYRDESSNSTYYVLAFVLTPGDVGYEATVVKRNNEFQLIEPTYTISAYNTRGNCVIEPNNRSYCVCKKKAKCNKNNSS